MSTAALASVPSGSPRVEHAVGMLSCLGGFSPRIPVSTMNSPGLTPRQPPHWSQTHVDTDLMHLEHSPDVAAKIMRKRNQEQTRNDNRLTPRMQRIGLDIAALNKQVSDKQAAANRQAGIDEQYLEGMQIKSDIVAQAYSLRAADLRQKQRDCVNYSFANLSKHQRREWDLSDPNRVRADQPARVEGMTPSISSMQKFEGEEGVSPAVLKEKRDSQVEWLMAQMAEKKLRAQLEKDMERENDEALLKANDLRVACELAAKQEQQVEILETARVNEKMASARTAQKVSAREREAAVTKEHMIQESEHNLMRERHDYSIGLNGKKRDYKRCSYEEELQGWAQNRALVQARLDRKRAQEGVDDEYHTVGATFDLLGAEYDHAWNNQNMRRRQQVDAANKALVQEKKEREAREKREYKSFASPR